MGRLGEIRRDLVPFDSKRNQVFAAQLHDQDFIFLYNFAGLVRAQVASKHARDEHR